MPRSIQSRGTNRNQPMKHELVKSALRRLSGGGLTWVLMITVSATAAQLEDMSVPSRAALDGVLGSNSLAWRLTPRQLTIEKIDGRTALCTGTNATVLLGSELFPSDVEYRLVFRFLPPTPR